MSKKIHKFSNTTIVLATLFLTGCGGHMINVGKLPGKTAIVQNITVSEPSISSGEGRINEANILALEAAALATIKIGYNYFAIDLPKGAVSNVHGSLINTTKDYIKTCNTNSLGKDLAISILTLGLFRNSSKDSCHISGNTGTGQLKIISYQNQPLNFTSYDARRVIRYLKDNKLYINIPNGEYVEKLMK